MASGFEWPYEPKPRYFHYTGALRGELLVFAGVTVDFNKTKEELSSTIQVFDQYLEQWRQLQGSSGKNGTAKIFNHRRYPDQKPCHNSTRKFGCRLCHLTQLQTTGCPPKRLYNGGCCVSPSCDLYVYDGDGLYKLSSEKWSQLSVESDVNGPMKKYHCRMVHFNKKKVAVIGGAGLPPASLQPGASFIKDERYSDGRGWTNEIHVFDTDECEL